MPCLHQFRLMIIHQGLNVSQFPSRKTEIPCQSHWLEPELDREAFSVYVHVGWLIRLVAEEIEAVWA